MKRILKKVSHSLERDERNDEIGPEKIRNQGGSINDEKTKRKRKRKRKTTPSVSAGYESEKSVDEAEEPPAEDESETGPANNRTVYIEGLPFDASDDDVHTFFKSIKTGSVVSIRLPRWHDSNRLRGYGHVEFTTPVARKEALELDGTYMGKRFIKVAAPMLPRVMQTMTNSGMNSSSIAKKVIAPAGCRRVFVKNLPYECTEEEVKESFKECGKILSVRLAVWAHTGQMKGFGYVDFNKEESAQIAVKKSGRIVVKGRPVVVDFETGNAKLSFARNEMVAKKAKITAVSASS